MSSRRRHNAPYGSSAPVTPPTAGYDETPRRHRSSARRERTSRRRDYSPEPAVDNAYYSDNDEYYYSDDPAYHRPRHHSSSRRHRTFHDDDRHYSAARSHSPPPYSATARPRAHQAYSSEEEDGGNSYENARRTSALKAALTAGALEAYRSRHSPGGITGRHALTRGAQAAFGAGTLEYMGGNSRSAHGRHQDGSSGKSGLLKAVAGSLFTQKVLSGGANSRRGQGYSRHEEEGSGGSGGALKKVIALATAARAGSKLLGAVRSGDSGGRRGRRYSG